MYGPSQQDNFPVSCHSPYASFNDDIASHFAGDISFKCDTYDEYGAFGASDASRDEKNPQDHIESLLDHEVVLQDYFNDTNEEGDSKATESHKVSSSSASSLNPPSTYLSIRAFDSPVEISYWSQLGLAPPSTTASQSSLGISNGRSQSRGLDDELVLGYNWRRQTLADIQVNPRPKLTLSLSTTNEDQTNEPFGDEEEEDLLEEVFPLSPLSLPSASWSTSSGSPPFPITPLLPLTPLLGIRMMNDGCIDAPATTLVAPSSPDDQAKASGEEGHPAECTPDSSSSADEDAPSAAADEHGAETLYVPESTPAGVPTQPQPGVEAEEQDDTQPPFPEAIQDQLPEVSPIPNEVTDLDASGPLEQAADEGPAEEGTQEPVDLNLAPEALSPASSEDQGDCHATSVSDEPVAGPSRKRKRVLKSRPAHELRELSSAPPEPKQFTLRVAFGRANKHRKRPVGDYQVEAVSCCRLADINGFCQFRGSDGGQCMAELPKDATAVRMHIAMHTDQLGWESRSEADPSWMPTCPWCGEARTLYRQLTRHILDAHLLMFAQWCPCGGTNTRANQTSNSGRHEDSAKHKAYLRELAEQQAVAAREDVDEDDDDDDAQPEFVEGSSKGTKRRRVK